MEEEQGRKKNNRSNRLLHLLVLLLVLLVGMFIGQVLSLRFSSSRLVRLLATDKVGQMLRTIEQRYVDSISVPALEEAAVRAVLRQLDPHTVFIPASQATAATEPLEGNFSGVGMRFTVFHDTVVVVQTTEDGPSRKAGVLPGDRILAVGDSVMTGLPRLSERVSSLLRGRDGTSVKISVFRPMSRDTVHMTLTRGVIPISSLDVAYMMDASTGFIRLNKFSRHTDEEFVAAVSKLRKQGMSQLILDLRDNTGGVMESAVELCAHFLPKGALIVAAQGRKQPRLEFRSDGDTLCAGVQLALLINESTASASEIVAGAIQDHDRGVIVGRRSFGKGLIQDQFKFHDGSLLRLTVARYYTPTGRSIQKSYAQGSEDYYAEVGSRAEHGEMLVRDSMALRDTVRYKTPGGRTVYGGGGIYPDVFVPVDTTLRLPYAAVPRNVVPTFAFEYVDRNRRTLSGLKSPQEVVASLDATALQAAFECYISARAGFVWPPRPLSAAARTSLQRILISSVLDNLFGDQEYFRFSNQSDPMVLRALELLNHPEALSASVPGILALKK